MIFKADKRNCIAVIDKSVYLENNNIMLNSEAYKQVKKISTALIERKIHKLPSNYKSALL
jgi:hypothetical protein